MLRTRFCSPEACDLIGTVMFLNMDSTTAMYMGNWD